MCFACYGTVFPHKVTLKVRQEHLILAEIQRCLPQLQHWFLEWDCPVAGGCSLKRPDMLWEMPAFYLHMEVDEGGNSHEDDRERLKEIQRSMGLHRPGIVLRINADGLLRKKQHLDGEIKYSATSQFEEKMIVVIEYIQKHILDQMTDDGMGIPLQCAKANEAVAVVKLLF